MAKALRMSPKSLMKNQPSPQQRWKLPVKLWIRELYEKRFGHKGPMNLGPTNTAQPAAPVEEDAFGDNIPFKLATTQPALEPRSSF